MISSLVKTILLDDTPTSNKVGERVYINYAPDFATGSTYCVIQAPSVERGPMTNSGQIRLRQGTVVVSCVAPTDAEAFDLAEAAQDALVSAEGTVVDETEIKYMRIASYEPTPIDQEGDGIPFAFGYQVYADYLV